jgi:hypothetical protein
MRTVTVGSDPKNDIIISDDPLMSNFHLKIVPDDYGNFYLIDFGSKGGTFVNGKKVSREDVRLNRDDVIRAGKTFLPWKTYFPQDTAAKVQQQSNGVGVAGFVLALHAIFLRNTLSGAILWILGLVLSFAGLFKKPRGLAIAGFIISLIAPILWCSYIRRIKPEPDVEEVDEVIPFAAVEEKPEFQGKDAGE